MIDQKRLKELLHYDPETGVFTWKEDRGRTAKKGCVAGHIRPDGYRRIAIDGYAYYANRMAWLYVYGYLPENCIDHVDRIRHNDKIANLREVSIQCNSRNCGIGKRNKSGVVGVSWHKNIKKWYSCLYLNSEQIRFGYFKSFTEAVKARWNGEVKYGWPNCNSTSSAYLYLKSRDLI